MQSCMGTSNRGLMIRLTKPCNGCTDFEFIVSGHSDPCFGKI
jgi:hypothetical protein